MTSEITLTFAGDESGDTSFAFQKGASKYFVVAMIATDKPDALRLQLQQIKQELHLHEDYEYKFHKLIGKKRGIEVFQKIIKADFAAWSLLVDKTMLDDSFLFINGREFYLYFVTELIRQIPSEYQYNATLILDESGGRENLATETRRVLRTRRIDRHFKKIIARDSAREPLIQLADLVAGAVSHRDSINGVVLADMMQAKLRDVIEFPLK